VDGRFLPLDYGTPARAITIEFCSSSRSSCSTPLMLATVSYGTAAGSAATGDVIGVAVANPGGI
jgi:hypothetical protein